MATIKSDEFGLQLGNVPLINLRNDFARYYQALMKDSDRARIRAHNFLKGPIKMGVYLWGGRVEALLTQVLRDVIVGVECAVSGAVFVEATALDKATPDLIAATKNPFKLRGGGTAHKVYNLLPGLLSADITLEKKDPETWRRIKILYSEIRNPLFHAYEVSSPNTDSVFEVLKLVRKVYEWIDGWHDLEARLNGSLQLNRTKVADETKDGPKNS